MPLTDIQIRNAKPIAGKTRKLSDGRGLQLWVTPTGSKLWNIAYRYNGKQKKLSLGLYPAIGLKEAREQREATKKLIAAGTDPSQHKRSAALAKAVSCANTFEAVTKLLIERKTKENAAASTISKVTWLLDMANAALGTRPVAEITSGEIRPILKKVEARGNLETARRLRFVIGEVFRHAINEGIADTDPTAALLKVAAAPTVKHRAALEDPKDFGGLLREIGGYAGTPEVKAALQLLALTFVRPGELRSASWNEFDLDGAVWTIPEARMKMRRVHKVPLAPQAVSILRNLKAGARTEGLVFPTPSSLLRPLSENAFNSALRRMGYTSEQMSAHGFRAVASTMLNETGKWNADAIEAQLSHEDSDETRRAYHRAQYWDERVRMMSWWADELDRLRDGGKVVTLVREAG